MFWADKAVEELLKRKGAIIDSGEPLIVRDEKTASGRVHVGSLRSASLHALVTEVLRDRGIPVTFLFEINDMDPMDGLPVYLDKATYEPMMGKPLFAIPAPDASAKNFAEYYGREYVEVMEEVGFVPRVYRASELYLSGRMNEVISIALNKRHLIRKIYKEESGGERPETWYPLNVICEQCDKLSTTVVTNWDQETVSYECREHAVLWTHGCGYRGRISPFNGNAKLPWKVDWPAKFVVNKVSFEGAGKDHYTKGGSRQVADRISREVFEYEPPYGVTNEFFLVGGAKMSSSKGAGASAREIADLLPPHILRLLLIKSDIGRQINIDPEGDTIPTLYDHYDTLAQKYWAHTPGSLPDDDMRVFEKTHVPGDIERLRARFLPRFSQIAFLVQMPHLNTEREVETMKGAPLTEADREELSLRKDYALLWLKTCAPGAFRFELQDSLPESARGVSEAQKESLRNTVTTFASLHSWDGAAIHTTLHNLKEQSGLSPKDFFTPLYQAFLGKDSGPKLGWFLSTLDKEMVLTRLRELSL
jgi:lysyl-tRNA synthetase, class I